MNARAFQTGYMHKQAAPPVRTPINKKAPSSDLFGLSNPAGVGGMMGVAKGTTSADRAELKKVSPQFLKNQEANKIKNMRRMTGSFSFPGMNGSNVYTAPAQGMVGGSIAGGSTPPPSTPVATTPTPAALPTIPRGPVGDSEAQRNTKFKNLAQWSKHTPAARSSMTMPPLPTATSGMLPTPKTTTSAANNMRSMTATPGMNAFKPKVVGR